MRRTGEPERALTPAPGGLGAFLLALWRLSRPAIWAVSLLPFYVGHLLASQEIVPGFAIWTAFWEEAGRSGATTSDFLAALDAWLREAWRFLIGLFVMGPLVWAATLFVNDVHDVTGDRMNPRRTGSPLVAGRMTRRTLNLAAHVAALLALAAALLVGILFAAFVAIALVLAWLYSVPPVRLKARPGMDVAVNALGIGLGATLAGWSLAAPLAAFPWVILPQAVLVAIAVYTPTLVVDREVDARIGATTLAVRYGAGFAYRVGWLAWILANAGALLLAGLDVVLPRRFLPVLVLFVPVLLYEYHALIGRARSEEARVTGIVVTSLTFMAVNGAFALMYTGLWR